MGAIKLKTKLKQLNNTVPDTLRIRLHRAISWVKCAEEQNTNPDLQFITLWIAYNACYAIDERIETLSTEKERFQDFVLKLVAHDTEKRFFKLLWNKFSGPVRLLMDNEFILPAFWDYQRGQIIDWRKVHEKSKADAQKYLAHQQVDKLLGVVLDRLYTLRNQIMHGGSTYKSKVNRAQVKDACNILSLIVPLIIDIMMDNETEDWGKIYYPVIVEKS